MDGWINYFLMKNEILKNWKKYFFEKNDIFEKNIFDDRKSQKIIIFTQFRAKRSPPFEFWGRNASTYPISASYAQIYPTFRPFSLPHLPPANYSTEHSADVVKHS